MSKYALRFKNKPSKNFMDLKRLIMMKKNSIIDRGLDGRNQVSFANMEDREVLKVILKKKGRFRTKKELLYI